MYKNQIYKKNEEVPCILKKYIFSSRTYIVESVSDHVVGTLRVPSHPKIISILRQAYEQRLIVSLLFKCVSEGKLQFYYKLETNRVSSQNETAQIIEETENSQSVEEEAEQQVSETIEVAFSNTNTEYNSILLQSLVTALGEKIDTQEKYDLAVNIIAVNKKLNIDKTLYKTIFNKATIKYQTKFWVDDILPFCSNGMVKRAWKEADEDERRGILQKLGIDANIPSLSAIDSSDTETCINNAGRETHQVEQEAAAHAITERKTRQNALNKRQQTLVQHSEELNSQRAAIHRRQTSHASDTARRIAQAQTENERKRIEQESRSEEIHIQEQLQQVAEQQATVGHEIEEVSNEITRTQQEIQIIKDTSSTTTIGGRGKLKINLKWQTIDDVDLHVYDPDGHHIYYGDKTATCQGILGQLDVDANAGNNYTTSPQENIYWDNKAPIGHYKVEVNMYNKRSGISNVNFTVTIIPEIGQAKTFTGVLKTNKETIHITDFNYTDNGIKYL